MILENDESESRELILTVLVFDVPSPSREAAES